MFPGIIQAGATPKVEDIRLRIAFRLHLAVTRWLGRDSDSPYTTIIKPNSSDFSTAPTTLPLPQH